MAISPDTRVTLRHDVRLALLVALLTVVGFGVSLEDDFEIAVSGRGNWLPEAGGLLLLLGETVALTFRRVAPLPVLAFAVAGSLLYQVLHPRPAPLPLSLLVALYTVAVVPRPLVSGLGAVVYLGASTAGAMTGWIPMSDDQWYTHVLAVVAAVMVGYGVALARARTRLAEQQAAELAREQDTRTREAVAQEKARIARELHDLVAHDVSVIVAQASATRKVLPKRPEAAAAALESVEAAGRDALDGLRRLVGLLRTDDGRSGTAPQPTLDHLPALLAQVRRAGLPVELTVRGRPVPLPASVELNAYRIIQEALTNTLKHAGPTRATVTLDYEQPEALGLEVRDYGPGRDEPLAGGTGYGLVSMRQRAALLAGEISADRVDGKGFRVAARLPIAGGAA